MDPLASVAQSAEMMARLLEIALATELDLQQKLIRFSVENQVALVSDGVRGAALDIIA